jgi:hypothetical protein
MVREMPTPQEAEDIDEACAALLRLAHCRGEAFGIEIFARADGVIEITLKNDGGDVGHRYAFVHGVEETPTHELRKLLESNDSLPSEAPLKTVAPPAGLDSADMEPVTPQVAQKGRTAA